MAVEYLQEGASSFAIANWFEIDGTTAGAGFTSGALLIVPGGGTSIVSDLDWSTLGGGNTGITYLKIAERFSGNIGTATSPLKVDADVADTEYATNEVSASGRIEHYGPGTFFISAAGGSSKISNFFQMGVGRTIVIAGTIAYLYQANGTVQVEASPTITKADLFGGSATFATKTTAGTTLNVHGGSHTIQRPFTTINVYGGTLNINTKYTTANQTVNIYGGSVNLIAQGGTGTFNVTAYGGYLDFSALRVDTTIATLTRYKNSRVSARPMGAALTITTQTRKDATIQQV